MVEVSRSQRCCYTSRTELLLQSRLSMTTKPRKEQKRSTVCHKFHAREMNARIFFTMLFAASRPASTTLADDECGQFCQAQRLRADDEFFPRAQLEPERQRVLLKVHPGSQRKRRLKMSRRRISTANATPNLETLWPGKSVK